MNAGRPEAPCTSRPSATPISGRPTTSSASRYRIVIYPAPDLKGQWIAHGLETDVVTQGDSPEHAIEMMGDAMKTLIDYSTRRHLTGRQGLPFISSATNRQPSRMPARYPRIRRRLKQLGIRLNERTGKGSHVVVDDGKGHVYTLPLHHGQQTELSDTYVRALLSGIGDRLPDV